MPVSLGPSHPLSSADVASLGTIYANRSRYETTTSGHVTIPTVALDPDKVIPSPLVEFRFSPDSLFLASRTETMPNAVWVWDVCRWLLILPGFEEVEEDEASREF